MLVVTWEDNMNPELEKLGLLLQSQEDMTKKTLEAQNKAVAKAGEINQDLQIRRNDGLAAIAQSLNEQNAAREASAANRKANDEAAKIKKEVTVAASADSAPSIQMYNKAVNSPAAEARLNTAMERLQAAQNLLDQQRELAANGGIIEKLMAGMRLGGHEEAVRKAQSEVTMLQRAQNNNLAAASNAKNMAMLAAKSGRAQDIAETTYKQELTANLLMDIKTNVQMSSEKIDAYAKGMGLDLEAMRGVIQELTAYDTANRATGAQIQATLQAAQYKSWLKDNERTEKQLAKDDKFNDEVTTRMHEYGKLIGNELLQKSDFRTIMKSVPDLGTAFIAYDRSNSGIKSQPWNVITEKERSGNPLTAKEATTKAIIMEAVERNNESARLDAQEMLRNNLGDQKAVEQYLKDNIVSTNPRDPSYNPERINELGKFALDRLNYDATDVINADILQLTDHRKELANNAEMLENVKKYDPLGFDLLTGDFSSGIDTSISSANPQRSVEGIIINYSDKLSEIDDPKEQLKTMQALAKSIAGYYEEHRKYAAVQGMDGMKSISIRGVSLKGSTASSGVDGKLDMTITNPTDWFQMFQREMIQRRTQAYRDAHGLLSEHTRYTDAASKRRLD